MFPLDKDWDLRRSSITNVKRLWHTTCADQTQSNSFPSKPTPMACRQILSKEQNHYLCVRCKEPCPESTVSWAKYLGANVPTIGKI